MDFKKELSKVISDKTNLPFETVFNTLEVPKDLSLGDFALPCFVFSPQKKKPPSIIADELAQIIKGSWFLCESTGPYLNFKINTDEAALRILSNISEPLEFKQKNKGVIGLESPSPNSNKPLHLGHVRNMLLGRSLKKIYEKTGKKVIWYDLINDRGVHICKAMLGYLLDEKKDSPKSRGVKGDLLVGEYYVKFSELCKNQPDLLEDAQKMLKKWEEGDQEVIALWKKLRDWWLEGVNKTYEAYNVDVDVQTFESEIYMDGRKLVLDALKNKIFFKDESGAVYADLEDKGLGKKYLLRADGTSIYITQDLFLAKKRFKEQKLDEFRYIVGNEQIYHFKVLFELFKLLGFDFVDKCMHVAYGLIYLPDGRMKSREGNVVDADDFKKEMLALSEAELKKRYASLSKKELFKRSEIISTGAINFFILKYDSLKDFTYFKDKSLSFQRESGPYIQYAHARICSILRKEKPKNPDVKFLVEEIEKKLVLKLKNYEDIVFDAANKNKPSLVANYLLDLAQLFNSYYQEFTVLKEDNNKKNARLYLIDKIRIVLKDGLSLLDIVAPEEM